jgi:ferredoxin--NADP+ reductase
MKHICIIGSGPAGCYLADHLLRLMPDASIDVLEQLPVPFGLIRYGVAPDHQSTKAVARLFDRVLSRERVGFFGNVSVGRDVRLEELMTLYDAVVLATGAPRDRTLSIPGEDLPGVIGSGEFVGWYNGHPQRQAPTVGGVRSAVVIGNGNVAIDVARMLVLDPSELAPTDTADHALQALAGSSVEEVIMLGRRGPAQAAFTNPELRELGELVRADVYVDPAELELDEHSQRWLEQEADPTTRRNVEILRGYAEREPAGHRHRIWLRFLYSPVEILGEGEDGPVTGVRVVRNRIDVGDNGRLRAVSTGVEEVIECGLVLRSIGYRGRPVDEIPFDAKRGLIRNQGGRVCDDEGRPLPGEYVVGWIKRGPSGVIGTNKKDATDTMARILEDLEADALAAPAPHDAEAIAAWLAGRAPDAVTWEGWQSIDAHERGLGEPHGRPRVKLVRVAALVAASRDAGP